MVKHMPHLWALFVTEVVVRSAKHVVKVLFLFCFHFFFPFAREICFLLFIDLVVKCVQLRTNSREENTQKKLNILGMERELLG